jgi:hypothetical protein
MTDTSMSTQREHVRTSSLPWRPAPPLEGRNWMEGFTLGVTNLVCMFYTVHPEKDVDLWWWL